MDGRKPGNCQVDPALAPALGSQTTGETVSSFSPEAVVKRGPLSSERSLVGARPRQIQWGQRAESIEGKGGRASDCNETTGRNVQCSGQPRLSPFFQCNAPLQQCVTARVVQPGARRLSTESTVLSYSADQRTVHASPPTWTQSQEHWVGLAVCLSLSLASFPPPFTKFTLRAVYYGVSPNSCWPPTPACVFSTHPTGVTEPASLPPALL